MWDLVLWPEIEPRPPALGAQSLNCWTTREVPGGQSYNHLINWSYPTQTCVCLQNISWPILYRSSHPQLHCLKSLPPRHLPLSSSKIHPCWWAFPSRPNPLPVPLLIFQFNSFLSHNSRLFSLSGGEGHTIHIQFTILTILKCTVQWHLVHSQCCAKVTTIEYQNIFIPPKKKPCPHSQSLPLPQPLATTHPLSIFVDLPILDVSYKWNHTTCGLFRLGSLTEHHVSEVHPCRSVY